MILRLTLNKLSLAFHVPYCQCLHLMGVLECLENFICACWDYRSYSVILCLNTMSPLISLTQLVERSWIENFSPFLHETRDVASLVPPWTAWWVCSFVTSLLKAYWLSYSRVHHRHYLLIDLVLFSIALYCQLLHCSLPQVASLLLQ